MKPFDFHVAVTVKNVAEEPIPIDAIEVEPPILTLSRTNDMIGAAEAAANRLYPAQESKNLFVLLHAKEERNFRMVLINGLERQVDEPAVKVRLEWRNTRRPLPFKRSVYVRTTVGEIKRIKSIALAKAT